MPPNEYSSGVQKSGGAWRGFFWFFAGLVAGAALMVAGTYFALRSTAFQSWIRNYFVSVSIQQSSQIASTTPPTQSLQSFAVASTTVGVPKSYASKEYYIAINELFFDYTNMLSVGAQIAPLFVKLNSQTAGGNYAGVIDLAIQIKILINKEKEITTSFGQHLVALSVANTATTDAITKSLTQDLISSGNVFRTGLPAYFDALDGIFSGTTPSSDEIARVTSLTQNTTDNLLAFKSKLQMVFDHFKDA